MSEADATAEDAGDDNSYTDAPGVEDRSEPLEDRSAAAEEPPESELERAMNREIWRAHRSSLPPSQEGAQLCAHAHRHCRDCDERAG